MKPHAKNLRFAVLATDVAIFTVHEGSLKVLLVDVNPSNTYFKNKLALPGGLIKENETADDSVFRQVRDKVGIKDASMYIEQLYTFSCIDRDPRGRVVSVAYIALLPPTVVNVQGKTGKGVWKKVKSAKSLAYDHDEILRVATDRLKAKLEYTTVAKELLPKEFTLSELQEVYEIILGKEIDKRNFRKKILSLDIVKGTGNKTEGGANRPAELYKFTVKAGKIITIM